MIIKSLQVIFWIGFFVVLTSKASGENSGYYLSRSLYDMLEFPWKDVGTDEGRNWALVKIDPHPDSGKQIKGDNLVRGRIFGQANIRWPGDGTSKVLEYEWKESLQKILISSEGMQLDPFAASSLFICRLDPEEAKSSLFGRKMLERQGKIYFFPRTWEMMILQSWDSIAQSKTRGVNDITNDENPFIAIIGVASREPAMNEWLDYFKTREKHTGKDKEDWIVEAAYYLGAFRSRPDKSSKPNGSPRQRESLEKLSAIALNSAGNQKEYLACALRAAMAYGFIWRDEALQLVDHMVKAGEHIPNEYKSLNSLKRLKEEKK